MELDQFKDVNLVIDKANDIFIPRQFVSQGDYKGRSLTVQITNNGSIGEVPGLTLNLNWHNEASGLTDLTAFTILNKENSIFRIEYPENMMTPGKVYASIQIIQDGKVTNLKQFELIVQKLAGQPVGIAQKAEFSALVAALADSNKFRTDIDKVTVEVQNARTNSSSQTYPTLKERIDNQENHLNNNINSKLAQISSVPEAFANLAALQSKYPTGEIGIFVTVDNGHKYIWNDKDWQDAGIYQSAGIADNSITLEKLSTDVYEDDYFNLSNIDLKGANTIGIVATFKRAELISGTSEINLKGTLKENCATNRLAQATVNIIGSEFNDLTAHNVDVIASKVVSFDKTQSNVEKALDLNFSVDLQQKPFIKLIISYAFDSNAGASNDTINLDHLELLVADENLNLQQKGLFTSNPGTAEISARLTGKAGLVTNAQLSEFVKKNDKEWEAAGVADNSITLEKLSTSVYTDDYFNLSNINLNGSNTIGVAATFKRAEIISGTSNINLKGILKENCATNRLAQATVNIIGSEINDLTAHNGDVVASKIVSFDKTQKNAEKALDLNFSVDLQQKPFIKLIISYAFDSNAGASTDSINLNPLELLVANENLSFRQKGFFTGNAGIAEISARLTGKAGLVTNAQLSEFVKKNDIKNVISNQPIYVTTAKEFVDAINTAGNTATSDHWVTINMAPGTYDLLPFVNLDISEVSALDNRGIEVPRYTKIVGDPAMGTLIVLRLPDETKTEAKWTVSPINLKNDAWLENLKIISFNCRYAIHDDGGTVSYSRLIKNCILINEGHGNIEFVNETPYGCGIYKGCHAYYDNVTFKGAGMAAYVHDNPTYDIDSYLTFNNCTFVGGAQNPDFAVRFHSLGCSANTNIELIDCKLNKHYQIYQEPNTVRNSMVITEIGNSLFDDSVSLKLIG